jgi:plastocyanin
LTQQKFFAVAIFTAALAIIGCKPDSAIQKGAVVDGGVKPASAPAEPQQPAYAGPTGNITGTISFAGKVPAVGTIDTSQDPACSLSSSGKLPVEQIVVKNGKLANVFVYVKSGPPEAMQSGPTTSQPVVLDQKNCQYIPHVIGVMQGGSVEFRNSDPTMHNIHTIPTDAGNQPVDISQSPRGQPQTKRFLKPELMLPVRCNNHPWMNTFINVSPTAFFAVTDASGHFDLRGLPPGGYVLGVVQEKLGEKIMQLTVKPNSTTQAALNF